MNKEADARLDAAAAVAVAAGVQCATWSAHDWQPNNAILQAAEEAECDAIFMASHARSGIACMLLGSETQQVLNQGKLPVIVYC